MNGWKILLAVVGDNDGGRAALDCALQIGRDQAAHVRVLHARNDPGLAIPMVGEGMSGAMVEEMMAVAEKEAKEREARAKALFEEYGERFRIRRLQAPSGAKEITAEWTVAVGNEEDVVARLGRVADLIVVGRAEGEDDPTAAATLNAALLETGRPVLVAPAKPPASVGRKIAIAWNGSAESARAVGAAMPLLARAQVTILSVAEEGPAGLAAGDLAAHLAWHGVAADVRNLDATGDSVGAALLAEATRAEADLLVMGAYTHSRWRQLIWGGVTRHVLEHASIPVLLAH